MRSRDRWRSSAVLVAALVALPGAAYANAAAPFHRDPSAAASAFVTGQTGLVVQHETLRIECAEKVEECSFEAVYDVANPTEAAEEVLGVFVGAPAERTTITVDGVDVRTALSKEQLEKAFESIPKPEKGSGADAALMNEARSAGFTLRVDPGLKRQITFKGVLVPTYTSEDRSAYDLPAIKARHVWYSSKVRSDRRIEFTYLLSPLATWGGTPNIDVTITTPTSVGFDSAWTTQIEGKRRIARITTTADRLAALRFSEIIAPPIFVNGGPFIGAGAEFEEPGGRLRAGYEIGLSDWALGSLAFELYGGRQRQDYTIVPTFEVATHNVMLFIPALSAGLGIPFQLHDVGSPQVGARVVVGLSFPIVSILVPVDVYFDEPSRPRAAFIGQVGF